MVDREHYWSTYNASRGRPLSARKFSYLVTGLNFDARYRKVSALPRDCDTDAECLEAVLAQALARLRHAKEESKTQGDEMPAPSRL